MAVCATTVESRLTASLEAVKAAEVVRSVARHNKGTYAAATARASTSQQPVPEEPHQNVDAASSTTPAVQPHRPHSVRPRAKPPLTRPVTPAQPPVTSSATISITVLGV